MPRTESQFHSTSTISCCRHCVPPKRHTACWGHCPEYLKEKAAYDALMAEHRKKTEIENGLDAQKYAVIKKTQKRGK